MQAPNKKAKQAKQNPAHMFAQLQKEIQALKAAAPAAQGKTHKARPPKIHSEGDAVVVTHSELFDWPVGQDTFNVDHASGINPGLQEMFPWLGGVAKNFEEYRFRKLSFSYEPRCSTQQAGQLVMAVDPKSGDANPAGIQTISTYSMRANSAMWKASRINVEHGLLNKRRFVRTNNITEENTKSLYDVGKFIAAVNGASPAGGIIGEIEVSYTVELFVPASPPASFIEAMWINGVPTGASSSNIFGNTPAHGGNLFSDQEVNGTIFQNCVPTGINETTRYVTWYYLTGTGITAGSASMQALDGTITNQVFTANGAGTIAQHYVVWYPFKADPVLLETVTATTISDTLMFTARVSGDQNF